MCRGPVAVPDAFRGAPGPDGRPYCRATYGGFGGGRTLADSMATAMCMAAASTPPMQRIVCPERDDWRTTAEQAGFDFHTIDGERYWDERAYYAFTLDEIERQIEAPTGEIDAMCLELVGRAVDDENYLRRLKIPEAFWPLISESWHRDEPSLYGRLDLSFDGHGPAKLLEYNADTPTSIFEAAVFQWTWLEQAIERQHHSGARRPVQFDP